MAARSLRSVMADFEAVDDPRVERTRRHDLLDIIAVSIGAVIGGADSWVEVEDYGNTKLDWLKSFLE